MNFIYKNIQHSGETFNILMWQMSVWLSVCRLSFTSFFFILLSVCQTVWIACLLDICSHGVNLIYLGLYPWQKKKVKKINVKKH